MQKQRLILIIGIILGVVAVVMLNVYLTQQKRKVDEDAQKKVETIKNELQTNQTAVLIAKEDILRGAAIASTQLEVKIIPNQFVQPQAVTSLDRVSGMLTIAPISKGEQVTLSKLTYPKQSAGEGLAGVTPPGKRAITISVDNISSLAGMIKPGDYVDIITQVNIPVQTPQGQQVSQVVIPLFQNVLILAVGQDILAINYHSPDATGGKLDCFCARAGKAAFSLTFTGRFTNTAYTASELGLSISIFKLSPASRG
jgi:pilus assembly protein CpaB